jgi:hypothetical protein
MDSVGAAGVGGVLCACGDTGRVHLHSIYCYRTARALLNSNFRELGYHFLIGRGYCIDRCGVESDNVASCLRTWNKHYNIQTGRMLRTQ